MKRMISGVLAALMLLTLAACSSGTGNASGTDDTTGSGAVSGAEYSRLVRRWAGPVLGRMVTMKMLP